MLNGHATKTNSVNNKQHDGTEQNGLESREGPWQVRSTVWNNGGWIAKKEHQNWMPSAYVWRPNKIFYVSFELWICQQ